MAGGCLPARLAPLTAGITIRHQIDTINCSIPLEHGTNRRIGSGKIQIAYKNILHFQLFSVFQLCGQDEADQDSQALAGLSKGTFSVARLQSPNPALGDDDTCEIPPSLPGNAQTAVCAPGGPDSGWEV